MKRVQLWLVDEATGSKPVAVPIEELSDTETERRLEDLLVSSPDLLVDGLRLVGRQVTTEGGPLDLVGVDEEGRLVVFELKRGTLTREAVAQILDYVSHLVTLEPDNLARLIEEHSGKLGIEAIEDFVDWYEREFPHSEGPLSRSPRMVLVGLGADTRATRIVTYLAQTGVDIQLQTFHAFRSNGQMLLGKQVESDRPTHRTAGAGKKGKNLKVLLEFAASLNAKEVLTEVAEFVSARFPGYRWPGRTMFSFSLPGTTAEGRPTSRTYFAIGVNQKRPGAAVMTILPQSLETVPSAVSSFRSALPAVHPGSVPSVPYELVIDRDSWPSIQSHLSKFLSDLAEEYAAATGRDEKSEIEGAGRETDDETP